MERDPITVRMLLAMLLVCLIFAPFVLFPGWLARTWRRIWSRIRPPASDEQVTEHLHELVRRGEAGL